jgi:hypothetical protein
VIGSISCSAKIVQERVVATLGAGKLPEKDEFVMRNGNHQLPPRPMSTTFLEKRQPSTVIPDKEA